MLIFLTTGACVQSSVVTSSGNLTFPQTRSGQTAQTAENCSSDTFRGKCLNNTLFYSKQDCEKRLPLK